MRSTKDKTMRNYKKINILITGLGGGSYGFELLKALKLSELPYYFVGTDITPLSYGLSIVDKCYVVPVAVHADYIGIVLDIIRKNNIHVLLPGSDPELSVIGKNRKLFQREGVLVPINTQPVIDLCMNKFRMVQSLKKKGIAVPSTFLISSLKDINDITTYPLVCKPHIGSGGSNNVFILQNKKELRLIAEYMLGYLKEFIAQEYVGDTQSEYTVGVLNDLEGNLIDSIAVKRYILSALSNRSKVPNKTRNKDLGNILAISSGISQGEIGRFREVTESCEEIAKALKSKGPLNFQCRLYNRKVYIFEINPRFSGTSNFRAMAGFNEIDLLIRKYLLKLKLGDGRISYREGVILRSLSEKFIVPERGFFDSSAGVSNMS